MVETNNKDMKTIKIEIDGKEVELVGVFSSEVCEGCFFLLQQEDDSKCLKSHYGYNYLSCIVEDNHGEIIFKKIN